MTTTLNPGPSQEVIDSLSPTVDLSAIGIFNPVMYGLSPSASATDNHAAIQKAMNLKEAYGGGIIMLPYLGASYSFAGTWQPGVAPFSLLAQTGVTLNKQDTGVAFNFVSANDGRDMLMRGFKIHCAVANTSPMFYIASCQNIRLQNIFFGDCAAAFFDSNSLACGMEECTAQNDTQNGIVCVTMEGAENFLINSVLRQQPIPGGGPTGCTGVLFSSNDGRARDSHVSDWDIGIDCVGGNFNGSFVGITSQSNSTSLRLHIPGSGSIAGLIFTACVFAAGNNTIATTPVVLVDAGSDQTKIDTTYLNGCRIYGGLGYGLQNNSGKIFLNGGSVSGNTAAGVAATGGTVYCDGVALNGVEPKGTGATQLLAYYVSAGGTLVAKGGSASGNTNGVVSVSSPGLVDMQGISGYNDQKTVVTQTPPGSTTPFSPASLGYYGRMTAYVGTVTEMDVAGTSNSGPFKNTGLTSGPLDLDPNEWAKLTYGSAPPFLAIGH